MVLWELIGLECELDPGEIVSVQFGEASKGQLAEADIAPVTEVAKQRAACLDKVYAWMRRCREGGSQIDRRILCCSEVSLA